jgi:hypothetical protein
MAFPPSVGAGIVGGTGGMCLVWDNLAHALLSDACLGDSCDSSPSIRETTKTTTAKVKGVFDITDTKFTILKTHSLTLGG